MSRLVLISISIVTLAAIVVLIAAPTMVDQVIALALLVVIGFAVTYDHRKRPESSEPSPGDPGYGHHKLATTENPSWRGDACGTRAGFYGPWW